MYTLGTCSQVAIVFSENAAAMPDAADSPPYLEYIVMAYIVMAYSYGLSLSAIPGIYSYGLHSYGLSLSAIPGIYSYGL